MLAISSISTKVDDSIGPVMAMAGPSAMIARRLGMVTRIFVATRLRPAGPRPASEAPEVAAIAGLDEVHLMVRGAPRR